jgi:hypothetical protein
MPPMIIIISPPEEKWFCPVRILLSKSNMLLRSNRSSSGFSGRDSCHQAHFRVLGARDFSATVCLSLGQTGKWCLPDICFYGQGTGDHGSACTVKDLPQPHAHPRPITTGPVKLGLGGMNGGGGSRYGRKDRGLRHPAVLEFLGLLAREVSNLRYETTPTCNPSRLAAGIA